MQTAIRSPRTKTLQRKCGCGSSCGSCREKRELRRSAIDPREPESVPRSVEGVLRGPGQPLDASLRQTLEPRFGHDFSSVRVHTGADAATATRDVNARAWTVGDHIAFGAGQSPRDLRLLAHELTHVIQQSDMPQASSLTVGAANDPAESEADAVASAVMSGQRAPIATRTPSAVRRYIPGPIVQTIVEWLRKRNPAGFEMTPGEITTAETVTGQKAPAVAAPGAGTEPVFVLHDTASLVSDAKITDEQGFVGPQGKGIQAWLPERRKVTKEDPVTKKKTTTVVAPDPVLARPFYETKRPSATAFERGQDIISLDDRAKVFRAIWKATSTTERDAALDRSLAGTGLAADKEKEIKDATKVFLGGAETKVDGAATTASWTTEEICAKRASAGAAAIAAPDAAAAKTKNADTLDAQCAAVARFFSERSARISSIVGVEIVQPTDADPLPNPPYLPKQYDDLAKLYISAALAALRWPKITTHRAIDTGVIKGGHGDPRCFNLTELYRLIADKMKHDAATIYGIVPKYGKDGSPGVNIQWTTALCHGAAPK